MTFENLDAINDHVNGRNCGAGRLADQKLREALEIGQRPTGIHDLRHAMTASSNEPVTE
jgi:hypothetical protein